MTGPLGPMNEDGVVDLLRAAGQGGVDPSPADVDRAMTAGKKIRRRRQSMQVVGTGIAVVAVVAAGVTTVSSLDGGPGRETVATAPDAATPAAAPIREHGFGQTEAVSTTEQRMANLQLLATALGPDFRVNPHGREAGDSTTDPTVPTYAIVEVVPGSTTAERIPPGYRMTASGGVPVRYVGSGDAGHFVADTDLATRCRPTVEKGSTASACVPVTLSGGQRVQVREFRTQFGKMRTSTGRLMDAASTSAFFPRVDGSFVQAELNIVAQEGAKVTQSSHDRAEALVGDFRDDLAEFAADPKVGPAPGADNGTPFENSDPSAHDRNQAYLQEALGSPTFSLIDGAVVLENNNGRYADLPSDFFSGSASLENLTQTQFDAACGTKAGFAGCEERVLPDGSKVYTNQWADRDATTDELRGESSAYYIRPDSTIVVATITLNATHVTAANRDEQVNGTLAWFDLFRDSLIKAVTDSRMTF